VAKKTFKLWIVSVILVGCVFAFVIYDAYISLERERRLNIVAAFLDGVQDEGLSRVQWLQLLDNENTLKF
jgi:hypothetical protein